MPQLFHRREFWERFEAENEELCAQILNGRIQGAYQRVTQLLESAGCPFVCELTCDDTHAVLIFTPESNPKAATEIDDFLALAPNLENWLVFGRRQRKHVDDALRILYEVYRLDASDARFDAAEHDGQFDIVMSTAVVDEMGEKEAAGFIDMFLEHALGEQIAMSRIRHKSIVSNSKATHLTPQQIVSRVLGE